jgi:pyrroloquinoline quinone (PQQ) biosynthesis protein C
MKFWHKNKPPAETEEEAEVSDEVIAAAEADLAKIDFMNKRVEDAMAAVIAANGDTVLEEQAAQEYKKRKAELDKFNEERTKEAIEWLKTHGHADEVN